LSGSCKVEIPKTVLALYWFVECYETTLFPATLSKSGTMIYLLRCCPAIGWGATIHDLVLDLHVSQFKVHMLWIL
jgi:hypothetical protein